MVLFCTLVFLAAVAQAQMPKAEGIPIKIGDTVRDVQKAYSTAMEPESVAVGTKKEDQLRLKTKGVLVVFDKQGKVTLIRLEAPWRGNLGGVKLGDRRSQVESIFGAPGKKMHPPAVQMDCYDYFFDDITTTRILFNQDDEVESIILFK